MSNVKKITDAIKALPNYSKYEYADEVQVFKESDRLLEHDLNTLECYENFEIEAPLNSFSDRTLNDHLYSMFKQKNLETPSVMQKLVTFYVKHYHAKLQPCIMRYLASKKMTLEDWSISVGENRRGDILNVFFLSMVTGRNVCIHVHGRKMWSTLQID